MAGILSIGGLLMTILLVLVGLIVGIVVLAVLVGIVSEIILAHYKQIEENR